MLNLQKAEIRKLIKLLEKSQTKPQIDSDYLFEKEASNNINRDYFKNPILKNSNECIEVWEKKSPMITSTFSFGLKIINQIVDATNDNFNSNLEGIKDITQEIFNVSSDKIYVEHIEFQSSSFNLVFFLS